MTNQSYKFYQSLRLNEIKLIILFIKAMVSNKKYVLFILFNNQAKNINEITKNI